MFGDILVLIFRIRIEYGERISPYSVQMRENKDQNISEYGHFLRSILLQFSIFTPPEHIKKSKVFRRFERVWKGNLGVKQFEFRYNANSLLH